MYFKISIENNIYYKECVSPNVPIYFYKLLIKNLENVRKTKSRTSKVYNTYQSVITIQQYYLYKIHLILKWKRKRRSKLPKIQKKKRYENISFFVLNNIW